MSAAIHRCTFTRKDRKTETLLKGPHLGSDGRLQYHVTAAYLCHCGNSINLTKVRFMRTAFRDFMSRKWARVVNRIHRRFDD